MGNKIICVTFLMMCLSGCAIDLYSSDEKAEVIHQTKLASIKFVPIEVVPQSLEKPDLVMLRDAYRALVELEHDEQTAGVIRYRLADLNMLIAEQQQEIGDVTKASDFYQQAVKQYQQILAQYPQHKNNQDVLYQLAKAYDLQGDTVASQAAMESLKTHYPDSPHLAEVLFRQGEHFFGQQAYSQAIAQYRQVIKLGTQSAFYDSAAYMLGWSLVKTEQTILAIEAFSLVLDSAFSTVAQAKNWTQIDSQLAQFGAGKKRLINDTVNIMARLFSYSGAELGIVAFTQQRQEIPYIHLLFDRLGQQFLNEDRYRDSATVYGKFAETIPQHPKAPEFAVKQIDAFILGDFPTLVLPAKHDFIRRYGINGTLWADWDDEQQARVSPFLQEYIEELAQFEHSRGQALLAKDNSNTSDQGEVKLSSQTLVAFNTAAELYQQFISMFPEHPETNNMLFNLAESLNDSQQYALAIDVYEQYAYHTPANVKAAEAGYAAILAYRQVIKGIDNKQGAIEWQTKQLSSQDKFVTHFTNDSRVINVQFDTMQQRFALKQYAQASVNAQQLLAAESSLSLQQRQSAQLVLAHSMFALEQYEEAEVQYSLLVAQDNLSSKRKLELQENLAASIYKQAEILVAEESLALAVEAFLRVMQKAPTSKISITAHFDAATHLMTLGNWSKSTELLTEFRQLYPSHPLTSSVADKLIYAYQQSENWLLAATELEELWKQQPETEVGRNALYVSAQYFLDANERQRSLSNFRRYAHQYPTPFAEATEARFQMSEFYLQSNEQSKRRYWLNKLIAADATAKEHRTIRSQYLAAMSSMVFANDAFYVFKSVKLNLPLNKSLQKKNTAMQTAINKYEQVLSYKVLEFDTAARFKLADIYHQLSKDLLSSQRPKNLNELELEQYNILLEEQAYPFEEQAIEMHESNALRSVNGVYDNWTKQSFVALSGLLPGRYNKAEATKELVDEIY